jgi:serine/threonine-protein kinase haspin
MKTFGTKKVEKSQIYKLKQFDAFLNSLPEMKQRESSLEVENKKIPNEDEKTRAECSTNIAPNPFNQISETRNYVEDKDKLSANSNDGINAKFQKTIVNSKEDFKIITLVKAKPTNEIHIRTPMKEINQNTPKPTKTRPSSCILKDTSLESIHGNPKNTPTKQSNQKMPKSTKTKVPSTRLDSLTQIDQSKVVNVARLDSLTQIDQSKFTLDILLDLCTQSEPISFEKYFDLLNPHSKIGEATYSDVYLCNQPKTAVKVIPIGQEDQSNYKSAYLELRTTKILQDKRLIGYIKMYDCKIVKGIYSTKMLKLWDRYDEQFESENVDPKNYGNDQLYLVLSMEYAGKDLEHSKIGSSLELTSIFCQIILSLAMGEHLLHFEHRDLHWGNVLIKKCNQSKRIKYNLFDKEFELETCGVEITLIDFTLSRLIEPSSGENLIVYNDLEKDPELFTGLGALKDGGDLQFDIYRWMRKALRSNWKSECSRTNIFWIYYMMEKLCIKYPDCNNLRIYQNSLLKFNSVSQIVLESLLDTKNEFFNRVMCPALTNNEGNK